MVDHHYQERFGGLERLYGTGALEKLQQAHIAVVGIGGVGTWAVEALARSGVGQLTLIDLDDVCITNTNRQLHAVEGMVGRLKVQAMAERSRLISPSILVNEVAQFLTPKNLQEVLGHGVQVVIDAMDSVPDKAALLAYCKERDLPLVVSGGAGGKVDPLKIRMEDLSRTGSDALLKAVRRKWRDLGDSGKFPKVGENSELGVPCVYSTEKPILPWEVCSNVEAPGVGGIGRIDCASGFGAVSFVTGTFGLALASWAISKIL